MKSDLLVQLLIGGFGITGFIGAIIAVIKLRPDSNQQAVSMASGAMETMFSLNQAQSEELERLRTHEAQLLKKIVEMDQMIASMRDIIHGMEIMDDDINFPPKGD